MSVAELESLRIARDALDSDPVERAALLDARCGAEADLRQRVEAQLRRIEEAESKADAVAATWSPDAHADPLKIWSRRLFESATKPTAPTAFSPSPRTAPAPTCARPAATPPAPAKTSISRGRDSRPWARGAPHLQELRPLREKRASPGRFVRGWQHGQLQGRRTDAPHFSFSRLRGKAGMGVATVAGDLADAVAAEASAGIGRALRLAVAPTQPSPASGGGLQSGGGHSCFPAHSADAGHRTSPSPACGGRPGWG